MRGVARSKEPASFPEADPPQRVGPIFATIRQMLMRDGIEHLSPSYFSLVMATSIISIAAELLGVIWLARCFFGAAVIASVLLWTLTTLRVALFPQRVLEDLREHAVSPGFFTIVAATGILGRQCIGGIVDYPALASGLWALTLLLWLLVTYAVFTVAIVCPRKPSLEGGLNGLWLIAAVATQSVSVLGTKIAVAFPSYGETILLVSLLFFLMGCMLYFNIVTLIFYRLIFVALSPADMTPPYWINMGATAIATQAGTTLLLDSGSSPLVTSLVPYLEGFTLFFWAAGTWWVPLLIALGVWAHLMKRVPLIYSPQIWGLVFPIGMYTASTDQLARVFHLDFLLVVPHITLYIAVLAWTLAFIGLLRCLCRGLLGVGRNEGSARHPVDVVASN